MVDFVLNLRGNRRKEKENWTSIFFDKYELYFNANYIDLRDINGYGLLLLGDFFQVSNYTEKIKIIQVEEYFKGNFYAIEVAEEYVSVKSSGFSLLPIFYDNDNKHVGSSVLFLSELFVSKEYTYNKKWELNQLLFNYQFSDDTIFKQIKLLSSFTIITIKNNNFYFNKTLQIVDYIDKLPLSWEKSLSNISELFIEIASKYIPDEKSAISFTGGFDGRTLVSIANFYNKDFSTYSYGLKSSDDVLIPYQNSKSLKIPYQSLLLDESYIKSHFYRHSLNYTNNSNGGNGFIYSHASYAAEKLSEEYKYLVSGVCGSELFRAIHLTGAVTSRELIGLFTCNNFDDYYNLLINSPSIKYLNIELYKNELNEIAESTWNYKQNLSAELTLNQKLYIFVYEEMFRKFFGSMVKAQMNYINVRTPYTDLNFFKELLKTNLAGVYSDFLTENPYKRFKGQLLYAEVIRKTQKKLYWSKTGKGYPPGFVRQPLLRPLLFYPYFSKRVSRLFKKTDLDNLLIISGVRENLNYLRVSDDYNYDVQRFREDLISLSETTNERLRDNILSILSIVEYKKKFGL